MDAHFRFFGLPSVMKTMSLTQPDGSEAVYILG